LAFLATLREKDGLAQWRGLRDYRNKLLTFINHRISHMLQRSFGLSHSAELTARLQDEASVAITLPCPLFGRFLAWIAPQIPDLLL
jgi:hypothetical protein